MRNRTIARAVVLLAAVALVVGFASAGAGAEPARLGLGTPRVGPCDPISCVSTIAFTSTRDAPADTSMPLMRAEVYLMNPDGTDPRRLTDNLYGDTFPTLSPDGKKLVFDSNRLTAGSVINGTTYNNIDDLFLMDTDGSEQALVTRGASGSWSPDSKNLVFAASASYYASGGVVSGYPLRTDPGSATSDSDIFVANLDDLLAGVEQPKNITNSPDKIDDDADWSPDGPHIVYSAHEAVDDPASPPFVSNTAELYLMNPDGTHRVQLTDNNEEERAAAWSADGARIVYSGRAGGRANPFRIFVMNADGSNIQQLTNASDSISDLTATWSPDGQQILFHRRVDPEGQQLWVMNADGTQRTQLTHAPGVNNLAHWGQLRLTSGASRPRQS
jgi:TolB protein